MDNLQIEKISQLPRNDSPLGSNDDLIVNREISPGVYKTRRGSYFGIFSSLISGVATALANAATALAWIANPISSDPNNSASLGTDAKIYVPSTTSNQDFETLATTSSPATISNTNAETIYPTNLLVLGSKNLVGAMYELNFNLSKGPSGHSSTIRIYINTANNLTGSPVKVLEYGSGFNSNTSFPFFFRYFRNSVGLVVPRDVNAAATVLSNLTTQSLVSTTPITFDTNLTYYFVITTQMNVTNSTETLQFAKLCLTK